MTRISPPVLTHLPRLHLDTDEAACVGSDPELWFPGPGRSGAADAHRAITICQSCPIQTQCAEQALAAELEHGIWGGLREDERATMIKRAKRAMYRQNARDRKAVA